ncbi:DUF2845 domain-containing protein [Pseudomonas sp.]|uniref:DUF2845 domain-containing protein n=1 Tax=Pseudomonas sp. TaxID=306 RepID=UPI00262FC4A3|nr:DUF2845 domain-containing protein [Pseudomonas sp.]
MSPFFCYSNRQLSSVLTCVVLLIPFVFGQANAATRCGTGLINNGDSMQTVMEKCGEPFKKSSEGPARWPNGVPRLNAAVISIWVYGPNGGAYQYLRFIDEKLVAIDFKRE